MVAPGRRIGSARKFLRALSCASPRTMKERNQEAMDSSLSLSEQRDHVQKHILLPIDLGQTWYILDYKWFETWKEYVNYHSLASNSTHDSPGPIDNGELLTETGELKDNLSEGSHFELVPEKVWTMLVKCYGLVDDQSPLDRYVIEMGTFSKTMRVELYPLELLLAHYKQPTNGELTKCSQGMTIGSLTEKMREMYEISKVAEVKLLGSYMSANYDELVNEEETLSQANLQPRQFVVIVEKEGGVWPDPDKYKSTAASTPFVSQSKSSDTKTNASKQNSSSSTSSISPTFKSPPTSRKTYGSSNGYGLSSNYNAASTSTHNYDKSDRSSAGLCGLNNLGNTCFMNAALQCLSNVPKLTEFFTSDKWQADLNHDNPLGMKGEIAETYAHLMKTMWSGKVSSCPPRSFKGAVGRFAPRFSGYQQQDSHELMAFLLDGLHEDLNRIRKKPFVELKDANGRPDEEVAAEAWADYQKRNNSIVVDLFHGQLKSTLLCPQCHKKSIIFDPFCYLSLPIPGRASKKLIVHYVTPDPTQLPWKCKVKVPADGVFEDLYDAVATMFDTSKERLVAAEMYRSRFHKVYGERASLRNIRENDQIFVYDLDTSDDREIVAVYFKEIEKKYSSTSPNAISWPILMSVPTGVTYDQLYDICRSHCKRFIDEKEERLYLVGNSCSDLNDRDEKTDTGSEKVIEEINGDEPMEVTNCASPDIGEGDKSTTLKDLDTTDTTDGNEADDVIMSPDTAKVSTKDGEMDTESITNHRNLFQIELVSQYGTKEPTGLPRDKPISFRQNTYTYLSLEFDKKIVGSVVKSNDSLEVSRHDSLYDTDVEKAGVTLRDCLDSFTSNEKLGLDDTWYCPNCKDHVQASKQFDLWKLPEYLVIQLKRYKSTYSHSYYQSRDKVDTFVSYPVEDLDLSDWCINKQVKDCKYDLIAVSNHYGGLGGGHYTAYAKNHRMNRWYYFDDSSVSSAQKDSVVSRSGYLLVYQRK